MPTPIDGVSCSTKIMDLFEANRERTFTPAEVIDRLNMKEWSIRKALYRLSAAGRLVHAAHGAYCLPGTTPSAIPSRSSLWDRLVDLEKRVAALEDK